jgi:NAD(P)-dependent dehydrogenase (short-subunit alcohol dehydrogenase family)
MVSLGYPRDYDETSASIGQLFDLTGRVAVITGGASGIGRAIGLGLARFGAEIVIADLNTELADGVAEEVRKLGRSAQVVSVDVTNFEQVETMAAGVHGTFGHLDICVNSAGVNVRKPAIEMTPDEYRRVVEVNLIGTWNVAKACGTFMVAQGRGKVINLASIMAHIVIEGNGAYSSSKGGVVQLTKVLAVEWAKANVQVNCLSPTYIRTPLTVPLQSNENFIGGPLAHSPTPRFGEAWELVGPAVFLASDASGLVTGHSLIVDGGWTAL